MHTKKQILAMYRYSKEHGYTTEYKNKRGEIMVKLTRKGYKAIRNHEMIYKDL